MENTDNDALATIAEINKALSFAGGESANKESAGRLSVPIPFEADVVLLDDTVVAGSSHVNGMDKIAESIQPGQKLRFERDPSNSYDSWAIRVFAEDKRIGFVSAEKNEIIARLMDAGKHIFGVVLEKEKLGNWNKIHMEVHLCD